MSFSTGTLRKWFFIILVAAACCMMVMAFTVPWWTADISTPQGSMTLDIFGWGIPEKTGPLEEYIAPDVTPHIRRNWLGLM